jgi:outer membrane protein assembly factor BamB
MKHIARPTWIVLFLLSTAIPTSQAAGQLSVGERDVPGGVIVVLDPSGESQLTDLQAQGSFLVHGLAREKSTVTSLRKKLMDTEGSSRVTVDLWNGSQIPLVTGTVNILVSRDEGISDEMQRVLAPHGIAMTEKGKTLWEKPWPADIDEWTHYLHSPDNNAVAHDTVIGPPRHLQWHAGPKWSRHHDHMSSINAMVSAGGKVFYILDEGARSSILLPPVWKLVARDAFNGTVLWKRGIGKWNEALWPLKSGPANLPRRLVARGNTVYATLGFDVPISALDAGTGKTLRTYERTRGTEEIILIDDTLLALVNDAVLSADVENVVVDEGAAFFSDSRVTEYPLGRKLWYQVQSRDWLESKRSIRAFRADTGEPLWKKASRVVPLTLAADADRVYFHNGEKVVAVNRTDGKEAWQSENVPVRRIESWFAPTLVVHQGTVLFAGGEEVPHSSQGWRGGNGIDTLTALEAETGKKRWAGRHPFGGYQSPEDLMVVDGLVWAANIAKGSGDGVFEGRDPLTGKVEKELVPTLDAYWFHHRCYRARATDKYFLTSRTGIETIDTRTGEWTINHWVRGACLYGIMPANGLIYAPPHPCSCYGQAKLFGFNALAAASPDRKVSAAASKAERLEKGPAYGEQITGAPGPADWPTYRRDAARSGHTTAQLSAALTQRSSMPVGSGVRTTPPVAAEGILLVAAVDEHVVYAFDAASGQRVWEYLVGGRVDSPPTIHNGRALFGSADGCVYCLRLKDGQLCWRFRAAPVDRRLICYDRLESVWPVHGSVLVEKNIAYLVAGRSCFLDGGIRLYGLDPATGNVVVENVLDGRDPTTGKSLQTRIKGLSMPVALRDIMSSNGEKLFMRSQMFDLQGKREKEGSDHLFAPFGFLDQTGFHRTYWIYGDSYNGTIGGFGSGRRGIGGRILVHDSDRVYGFGRKPQYFRWASAYEYQLFAADMKPVGPAATMAQPRKNNGRPRGGKSWQPAWAKDLPFLVQAMVLADKTLFIAGSPSFITETDALTRLETDEVQGKLKEHEASLRGERGGVLWAVSAEDGSRLAEYPLDAAPVFDGMIAANGKLYISARSGEVLTFEAN